MSKKSQWTKQIEMARDAKLLLAELDSSMVHWHMIGGYRGDIVMVCHDSCESAIKDWLDYYLHKWRNSGAGDGCRGRGGKIATADCNCRYRSVMNVCYRER